MPLWAKVDVDMQGEAAIRARLHRFIDAACPAGSIVIDEYGVGPSIADVAVFEPSGLWLFEIKSDLDSDARLSEQARCYSARAAKAYLVAGERLLRPCMELIPPWWGVLKDADGALTAVRAPQRNTALSPVFVCETLWRREVLTELNDRGLAAGTSKLDRVWLRSILAKSAGLQELQLTVYGHVARRKWFNRKSGPVRVVPERTEAHGAHPNG